MFAPIVAQSKVVANLNKNIAASVGLGSTRRNTSAKYERS